MKNIKPGGISAFLLPLVLAATACSTVVHPPSETAARPAEGVAMQEDVLLQCVSRFRGMSAGELSAEGESLQKAWTNRRSEDNRMRLALFLATAPLPQGDRGRALALLDVPPSEQNGRGRTHPLAQVLLPVLQDYRRLDESVVSQQQKLRELQQSNEQMRQKLDALREIEMQIQERPKTK